MATTLDWLLDPVSRVEFRDHYYGRQPLLVRGHAGKFAGLFSWDDLNRVLNASVYPHHNVEITGPTTRSPAASPVSLIEQCRAGASLVFTQLQLYDPKIGELARTFEAETGEPAFVTLVLSQPSQAAFPSHYDRQDVFVLHVDGHKAWTVHDRTVEKPITEMPEGPVEPPSRLELECELAPGDLLYIPRGHWHQALAQGGMSVHLTLGVSARTGIDFLTWLVNQLRGDVRFRHELPLSFAEEPAGLHEERLREHVAGLRDILGSRLAGADIIPAFHRSNVLEDRDVRRFRFPAQLLDAPLAQLGVRRFARPSRQRFVLDDEPAENRVVLNVWGHIFQFPATARPLLEFIVSRTAFDYEDALAHAGALTEEGVREVLDPLLREGILDAADPPSGSR